MSIRTGRSRTVLAVSIFSGFLIFPSLSAAQVKDGTPRGPVAITYLPATKDTYRKLAAEVETTLRQDILDVWFPRAVDIENGGFYASFDRDWSPGRSEGKFSVFQGRMTWISSQVAMRRPDLREKFLPIAIHGLEYLNNVLWDKKDGGFFLGLDDKGRISPFYTEDKHLYGTAFAIYGAAAAYQATHDPRALALAQNAFRWVDEHAHDAQNGGYFEFLTRDGKPILGDPNAVTLQVRQIPDFPIGFKSMNTHIHLLEAFSQLYEVWRDDTLRRRLEELLIIIRDTVCVSPGVMNLYFTFDWRAYPDHDSHGHDVETAYLMLEAEEVLGKGHDPKTERVARMLVDHALAYGWDETYGGFFGDGTTFGKPENRMKEWWVEMEGLNALLLMHEKYGRQTDVYFKDFQRQWQFIRDYQVDHQYHGIYQLVGPDGQVVVADKGRIWKAAYHDGRAMLNVTERLHRLAEAKPD